MCTRVLVYTNMSMRESKSSSKPAEACKCKAARAVSCSWGPLGVSGDPPRKSSHGKRFFPVPGLSAHARGGHLPPGRTHPLSLLHLVWRYQQAPCSPDSGQAYQWGQEQRSTGTPSL